MGVSSVRPPTAQQASGPCKVGKRLTYVPQRLGGPFEPDPRGIRVAIGHSTYYEGPALYRDPVGSNEILGFVPRHIGFHLSAAPILVNRSRGAEFPTFLR